MDNDPGRDEALVERIIAAFNYVHRTLGHGFLESVYGAALERVLKREGLTVRREVGLRVWFEQSAIAWQRMDMVVDGRVLVEIKSTKHVAEAAHRQLCNYLTATRLENGLLLHFGEEGKVFRHQVRSRGRSYK